MTTPLTPATGKKRTACSMEEEGGAKVTDSTKTLRHAFKILEDVGKQWGHDRRRGAMSEEAYNEKLTTTLGVAHALLHLMGPAISLLEKDDASGLKTLIDNTKDTYTAVFEGKPVSVLHAMLRYACLKGSYKCFDAVLVAWSGVLKDAKHARGVFLVILQSVHTAPFTDRFMDSDIVAPFKMNAIDAVKHVLANADKSAPNSFFGFAVRKALIYCSRKRESIEDIKRLFETHPAKSVVETALVGFLEVHGAQKE